MKKNIAKTGLIRIRDAVFLIITFIIAVILLSIFPDKQEAVTTASWKFFIEMIWILPGVMVLMGLLWYGCQKKWLKNI